MASILNWRIDLWKVLVLLVICALSISSFSLPSQLLRGSQTTTLSTSNVKDVVTLTKSDLKDVIAELQQQEIRRDEQILREISYRQQQKSGSGATGSTQSLEEIKALMETELKNAFAGKAAAASTINFAPAIDRYSISHDRSVVLSRMRCYPYVLAQLSAKL